MVVKGILFLMQTLLFLALFAMGSVFLPFLPGVPVWQVQTGAGRAFVVNGVIFALAVFLLIVGGEAARKRLRGAGVVTSSAFVLALVLGLLMRFGFKSL